MPHDQQRGLSYRRDFYYRLNWGPPPPHQPYIQTALLLLTVADLPKAGAGSRVLCADARPNMEQYGDMLNNSDVRGFFTRVQGRGVQWSRAQNRPDLKTAKMSNFKS
jgi:hypothetical protein